MLFVRSDWLIIWSNVFAGVAVVVTNAPYSWCLFLFLFSSQVSIAFTNGISALQVWHKVLSDGMMTTTMLNSMKIKGHFLMAYMTTTQRSSFVVEQMAIKFIRSYSHLKLHFSCWHMNQGNVKWWNGQQWHKSGFILTQKIICRIMTMPQGHILLTLAKSTRPFSTASTRVSK